MAAPTGEAKRGTHREKSGHCRPGKRLRSLTWKGIVPSEKNLQDRLVVRQCTSLGEAFLQEQAELRCCMVAVGRRGLSHNAEVILGSTSSHILDHATHCALLVVE